MEKLDKTLVETAIETHKAIYGCEPRYRPYKDASDHPFGGIDLHLMKDLVNVVEVKKRFRSYNKSLKETYKEGEIKLGDFVTTVSTGGRRNKIKDGRIVYSRLNVNEKDVYMVVSTGSLKNNFIDYKWVTEEYLKKRNPEPGERDTWDTVIADPMNLEDHVITESGQVSNGESALYKFKNHDRLFGWVQKVYSGGILPILDVRVNRSNPARGYSSEKKVIPSALEKISDTTSN